MFQTHDNCEHLAMMEKTIGSPPNYFAKKCKHQFYTRVGTNYILNWDENTEDGIYVKTNCKPLEVIFFVPIPNRYFVCKILILKHF